jgi:hypothetical protein
MKENNMWKQWFRKFWWVNGERIVYSVICLLMSIGFIWAGLKWPALKELVATGIAVLIGLLMYLYNRIRGNGKEPLKEDNSNKV